jgi:DNA ligase 1
MKEFTNLYLQLDGALDDDEKSAALAGYFSSAAAADAAWALFFLSGRHLKTRVKVKDLRLWAEAYSGIAPWLFEECYQATGDLQETIALILPPPDHFSPLPIAFLVENTLNALDRADDRQKRELVVDAWRKLDQMQRLVFNRLVCNSFHAAVSDRLLCEALSNLTGTDLRLFARRLAGEFTPSAQSFRELCRPDAAALRRICPYAFQKARALTDDEIGQLNDSADWLAEWKWDGLRGQIIKREGTVSIWSAEDQLLNACLPELVRESAALAEGTVLDGEILAWKEAEQLPFHFLQKRLSRKKPASGLLKDIPVVFMAFDLLEENGIDIRNSGLEFRQQRLAGVLSSRSKTGSQAQFEQLQLFAPCRTHLSPGLRLSPVLPIESRQALQKLKEQAEKLKVEGLVFKRRGTAYGAAEPEVIWLAWQRKPVRLNAVLVAAQPGSGRQAGLLDDCTFALWHEGELLSFARARLSLSRAEVMQLDKFSRENTLARWGPLRTVKAELVFELDCPGIQPSNRYKAGIAAHNCRILRWRQDLSAPEADSLEAARGFLNPGKVK